MKDDLNTNANRSKEEKAPGFNVVEVHSFSGKRMKDAGLKKLVDGALTKANDMANSIPTSIVVEEEWTP